MKKLSIIVSSFIFVAICSSNRSLAQAGRIDPCPPGYCSNGITFTVEQFNFHKPRTDCQSRFGICLKGQWSAHCVPCWSNGKTSYENGKVTGWFKISGGKVELHLPLALGQAKEFMSEDMSVFYIDDDTITILNEDGSKNGQLKGGEYTVTIIGDDYVVQIDII